MAKWGNIDVIVLGATAFGQSMDQVVCTFDVADSDIQVHISFQIKGPRRDSDPPWGPITDAVVPMSELTGRVEYAISGGMMVNLREV